MNNEQDLKIIMPTPKSYRKCYVNIKNAWLLVQAQPNCTVLIVFESSEVFQLL